MDLTYGGSLGSGWVNAASQGCGVSSQEEEAAAKDDTAARTISVAVGVAVHQHVVAATTTTCRKGAAGSGYNNNNHRAPQSDGDECPLCQVCFNLGHTADRCWHRFDENYVPDAKLVAAATNSYTIDTNWYTDTSATHHIMGELEKLPFRNKYHGGDQIHTADGAGMDISHIGHSTIHAPSRNIHLKNSLYVPQAKKNLVSVHKLASDNDAYLEFHLDFFLIKDQATKSIILEGRCHKGLYPLPVHSIKQACGASRAPLSRWHSRLGHPLSVIVNQVISKNNPPVLDQSSSSESVCDACQQAKSHQLPYSRSSSVFL
jgi:hypothetical protein